MDRHYIDLHLITDRYLQGQLSERETADFEERLAWDRDLIDEVDLAARLRDGLRASVRENELRSDADSGGILATIWSEPRYAAAASFALAFMMSGALFLGSASTNNLDISGYDVAPTELIPLAAVRGTDAQQIFIGESSPIVLLIDATNTFSAFRISVSRKGESGASIWSASGVEPTYMEMLAIVLPPGSLDGGEYQVAVEGMLTNPTGETVYEHVQEISFEAISER